MNAQTNVLQSAQSQYGSLSRVIKALGDTLKFVAATSGDQFAYATANIGVNVVDVTRGEFERGVQINSFSDDDINIDIETNPDAQTFSYLRLPTSLADRLYVAGECVLLSRHCLYPLWNARSTILVFVNNFIT